MAYHPKNIETFWQQQWLSHKVFCTSNDYTKPKYYALDMFPYPSAFGLHVGHPIGYTATDICARYYRMKGFNVLHPMGWDAFGLPAEQHAIETGENPKFLTERNMQNYKRQLQSLGCAYDWDREIATCDPQYYKWTQWIFTKLFEKGLAYQAEVAVNWCPALKTVLANEEVIDGQSERGGHPVLRVPMKQWLLKITDYAERLLKDLDKLDWPESTKEIQRNWIGKSVGAHIYFKFESNASHQNNTTLDVFTTRQDTLDGVTFLVVAPEHPILETIVTDAYKAQVRDYQRLASQKSELTRSELSKEKTGVFTGAYAYHPITQKKLPIWVADYVLASYGMGAIMAVPGHDERDLEFAQKYNLEVIQLTLDDDIEAAKEKVNLYLADHGIGKKYITYKLRDWIFSRQRYWGEPIPILKDRHGNVLRALSVDELPLTLPQVQSYEPTDDGKGPLALIKNWVQRTTKDGETVFVETDTMPGSAGSSWYFLRYIDPLNQSVLADYEKLKYWMPVDFYVGGQEHAVGHLLYARFWTKFLYDIGVSPVDEPFKKLVHQGMLCRFGAKMSKSKGNGVNPDDIVNQFGADTLRVYLMFMGPLTQTKEWDDNSLNGIFKFLGRIERHFRNDEGLNLTNENPPHQTDLKILHKTIKKVTEDIANLSFNTAIAQMMIFMNHVTETKCLNKTVLADFLKILSPFAPHLCEELWYHCVLGLSRSEDNNQNHAFLGHQPWPDYDPALVVDEEITIGVQVNGKHRGEILIPIDTNQDDAVQAAYQHHNIKTTLDGKQIKKIIFVKNRILNFVI